MKAPLKAFVRRGHPAQSALTKRLHCVPPALGRPTLPGRVAAPNWQMWLRRGLAALDPKASPLKPVRGHVAQALPVCITPYLRHALSFFAQSVATGQDATPLPGAKQGIDEEIQPHGK